MNAIIKLPGHGSGFFSNYFSALSMVEEAHLRGLIPYVDFTNTAFVSGYNPYKESKPPDEVENPWEWWFIQAPLDKKNPSIKIEEKFSYNLDQTKNFFNYNKLKYYQEIASKYFYIRPNIIEESEAFYKKKINGHITLGVMARGSEMNKVHPLYGEHGVDRWINEVRKITNKHREIDQIFLVTEESEYVNQFKAEFKNLIFLDHVFRRTTEKLDYMVQHPLWPCLYTARERHTEKLGRESLVQAILLSKCDYLIGKQCGTTSAAIFFSKGFKKFYFSDTNQLKNKNLTPLERIKFFIKRGILKIR
jgi:hypothetical protein